MVKGVAEQAEQAVAGHAARQSGVVWSAVRAIQRCFRGLWPVPTLAKKNESGQLCQSSEEQRER